VAGHDLQQVWRKDNVAVFARSIPGRPPHEHEVVIIGLRSEGTLPDGTRVPARYAYPQSSEWGKYGWSIPGSDSAIAWAEMVLANLGVLREARTAWPELFSRFKTKICNADRFCTDE
jgi:hypothetical protein